MQSRQLNNKKKCQRLKRHSKEWVQVSSCVLISEITKTSKGFRGTAKDSRVVSSSKIILSHDIITYLHKPSLMSQFLLVEFNIPVEYSLCYTLVKNRSQYYFSMQIYWNFENSKNIKS